MICDSYLNLSLISGAPGTCIMVYVCIVFSLELLFKRENMANKKAMGVRVCIVRCQDSRVYSSFLNDNSRENEVFVGRGWLWDRKFPPGIAFLRFFASNPFSRNENWTFINVHFWKS
jgi:hypothetical protein